jgi:ADP-dependent phosphofructokinase/glucokinase
MDYSNFAKQKDKLTKEELKNLIRESDDRLVSGLQSLKDREAGSYMAEYGIRAKKKLEDWGILSPDKFVVE